MRSLSFRHAGILALGLFSAACGSGEADKRSTTLGPTSVPTTGSLSAGQSVAVPASASTPLNVRVPATSDWTLLDLGFPPRNEPFDFRSQLETKYRDGLRRDAVSTYVDIEGSIVWTQEYLRYRLSGCDHASATQRVLTQIDSGLIGPACGPENPTFPPRDQPFNFRQQLEAKYRDGLRRGPSTTFVDVEGDIVWTQEYLRYRVSGCAHQQSTNAVLDQIDRKPAPAPCGLVFTYTLPGRRFTSHDFSSPSGTWEFILTWPDSSADLDLALSDASCIDPIRNACILYGLSQRTSGTEERFTASLPRQQTYRAFVVNFGTRETSYVLRTRAVAGATAASVTSTARSQGPVRTIDPDASSTSKVLMPRAEE